MIYSFGNFRLDTDREELRRAGVRVEVEPKVFAVLHLLIRMDGRVVSKAELRDAIWPGERLSDGVLTRSIWAARKAVDDDGDRQGVIRTVHRRGYRFAAERVAEEPSRSVRGETPDPESAAEKPESRIEDPGAFVGRHRELRTLDEALDTVVSRHSRVVIVRGEAGVGKTRLLRELGVLAGRRGARVLEGGVPQDSGVPPYWPWRELLAPVLESCDRRELATLLGDRLDTLAEVFPELRQRFSAKGALGRPSDLDRLGIYDGVARLLESVSRSTPHVLLLEDVHWADPSSLALLRYLQGALGRARVLIAASFRTFELHREDPRAALCRSIAAQPGCVQLDLGGFDIAECARLAELVAGQPLAEAWSRELFRRSDGLPLALIELVHLHGARGDLARAPTHVRTDPVRALATLDRRLDRLSTSCLDVLARAAAFGLGFRVALLAQISPESEESLLRSLAEAETAHIIEARPEVGSYQFRHALVREAAYARSTAAERAALHRQIGRLLERIHSGSECPPHAELVHHLGQSPFHEDQEKVVRFAQQAADAAARLHSHAEASTYYLHALRALEIAAPRDLRTRGALLEQLGFARIGAGEPAAAADAFEQGIGVARELGDPDRVRAAVLALSEVQESRLTPDVRTVSRLDQALQGASGRLRVRLLYQRVAAANLANDPRAAEWSAEGLALARSLGDPALILRALAGRHLAIWSPDSLDERFALDREMLGLIEAGSDSIAQDDRSWAQLRYAIDLLERGDLKRLAGVLEDVVTDPSRAEEDLPPEIRVERIRERNRLALHSQGIRLVRNTLAILRGAFSEAEAVVPELRADAERLGNGDTLAGVQLQTFALRHLQGRGDEVLDLLRELLAHNPGYAHSTRAWLALGLADLGRHAQARAELEAIGHAVTSVRSRDRVFLSTLTSIAEASYLAEIPDRARAHYELLAPFHDRPSTAAIAACTGSVSRALGMLATLCEDYAAAAGHFEFALQHNAELGARPFVAATEQAYAQMLRRRGDRRDATRRRRLARSAAETARALGMPHLEERARSLLD